MNFGKYLQRYPPINFWFCIDQNCFLLSFFYQSIKKYLNPPSKKDPLNLWNSFRYTTMLHVIKKIQQQKKNRQEIFYCVKWLSDFLQRSDLTFWLLFLLLYSILFFRFTPWRPQTHNWVSCFWSRIWNFYVLMISRSIFLVIKNRMFDFLFVLRFCHSALKRRTMVHFFSAHICSSKYEKVEFDFFSNLVENLVKLVKRRSSNATSRVAWPQC